MRRSSAKTLKDALLKPLVLPERTATLAFAGAFILVAVFRRPAA